MNWTKGPTVGRGSTATVSLATTVSGDLFAVKSTELSNSSFLQKEQRFLSKLSSPHIIKYIGFDVEYVDHVPMYNLLMEYAPGGSISDVMKKQGGSLDEYLIRSYTRQILLGLDYLHSSNLVHCDIKCSNILVCEDGVKIGDLGCAKLVENNGIGNTSSEFSGTPIFMAPEVARGEDQGFAADVWAVGCAVIEMATGCNPWPEVKNPVSALYRIGYSGDLPLFPVWLSEEAKDFLKKCLRRNDKERWTSKELLQHPFVDLNSSLKKIENFPKNSPSGVLDQGFWDSFEVTDSPAPTKFTTFSGESPVERIKQLAEASPLVNSCLPNWVEGEDWITVRSNHMDESSNVSHENLFTDADMEDGNGESTRSESELYVEEGFSISVRFVLESNVLETCGASVVNSRFLDFIKINNNNNNNSFSLVDSNLNSLLALHIFGDLLLICKDTSLDESHHK
ncbi:hypothetical protein L1987_19666 [Smallanthus sonchifolius]|uniref:Uncharacterized protein n=1 Tax=Smallanthus sonchifolius TaxID=185202 RepID=A0ACB9IPX5_9ASTR|nr:hypothetical protein L1987_19666 [Smallanthus sonchifolius]